MNLTTSAAFSELDWRRIDTSAIVFGRGLTTVVNRDHMAVTNWLALNGYQMIRLDFNEGISPVVSQLGCLLNWEPRFGYVLAGDSRNLAALRDGFDFKADSGGLVLELSAFDKAHLEDGRWALGFLSIISEHSLRQLALGHRLFAILWVDDDQAEFIGLPYEELAITPAFHWRPPAV